MDAGQLIALLLNHDIASFLDSMLSNHPKKNKKKEEAFYDLNKSCFEQLEPDLRTEMLMRCILELPKMEKDPIMKYSQILLGLIPKDLSDEIKSKWKDCGLRLLRVYWAKGNSRLVAKVSGIFNFTIQDFNLMDLVSYVLDLLSSNDTFAHGLALISNTLGLNNYLDLKAIIRILIRHKSYNKLIEWIGSLDSQYHSLFIEECINNGRLKLAWIGTKAFDLSEVYGFTERLSKEQTLRRLMHQKLWGPAMELAEDNQELQVMVICTMVNQGEYALAKAHQDVFNLSESIVHIDPELLRVSQVKARNTYLQLTIPENQIQFINEESKLNSVFSVLLSQNRVGLDSEWKPGQKKAPASILQLASEDYCFILDMELLGTSEILLQLLKSLFSNPEILKLGFSFHDDFKAIQRALQSPLENSVNLVDLQQALMDPENKKLSSLKNMTTELLGKPLNKGMQVSNWKRRPLTRPQLIYAALDAHVLLLLHNAILQNDQFKERLMKCEHSYNESSK
eukprot:g2974.t1